MTSAVLKSDEPRSVSERLADLPHWVWWFAALAVIAVKGTCASGSGIYGNLGDADDATRLIQVRELLEHWRWFDTTTMKIGGDAGMLSHWSRFIDLPIAIIIALFSQVTSVENAERLAHVIWPTALFGAVLWVAFRSTAKVAGERAGLILLALAVMSPFAVYQFVAGRIDHHNAMIAATVSATLLIWANPYDTRSWRIAGILSGLALAVGYEALAPAVALGVFLTIWAFAERRAAEPTANFAIALAFTFTFAFVATISPSRWMDIHCDAISLNMVALVVCGTAGVAVACSKGRDWPLAARLAAIAATTAIGLVIFGALEPKCLAGPKGQLPPLLAKVWLDKVAENDSILREIFVRDFELSLGLFIFFLLGLAAQARTLWKSRTPPNVFLLAALSVMTACAFWQYKYMGYASLLAIVSISVWISRIESIAGLSAATLRFGAVVLASQAFLLAFSGAVNDVIGAPKVTTEAMRADASACSKPDAIRDLAGLPPGLVSSHIDIGAYIAALTPHRALAAPYHRIANAIITNDEILSARDSADAAKALKREPVNYVVLCRGLDEPFAATSEGKETLRGKLIGGHAPGFLLPVGLPNPQSIFMVWKVDRTALNLQP